MKSIEVIKINYPELYTSVKQIVMFDNTIKVLIEASFPGDILQNIISTQNYHQEIDNVNKGIYTENFWNKFAQRRKPIMDKYLKEASKLGMIIGHEAIEIVGVLEQYFETQ